MLNAPPPPPRFLQSWNYLYLASSAPRLFDEGIAFHFARQNLPKHDDVFSFNLLDLGQFFRGAPIVPVMVLYFSSLDLVSSR